ncbi:MAG: futalosine hydrolase [Pedobacter sp.]|nr:MAG: futalosine hydrolase [Pedobacter sp.]
MKTLVVAATHAEIQGLFAHYNLAEAPFVETAGFDILITGVGMTATAFALGRTLSTKYNLVLNLGIGGCFDRHIPLGQLVHVTSDTFAELGAEDKDTFLPIDELGFGKSIYSSTPYPLAVPGNLKEGSGITVNTVHGNTGSIRRVEQRLHPLIESMEGAAVFYACEQLNIPAIQVRSISNYVEQRNREAWKIGLAIANLNAWAIDFLTNA